MLVWRGQQRIVKMLSERMEADEGERRLE